MEGVDSTTITLVRTGSSPEGVQAVAERDAQEIAEKLGGAVGNSDVKVSPAAHRFSALARPEYEARLTFELVATG